MLRTYASPQNFDEGIEFGYPSIKSTDAHSRPSLSLQRKYATTDGHTRVPSAQQTFLDMSSPSIIDNLDISSEEEDQDFDDNEDTETRSLPDRHSPYTPEDATFPQSYLLSPSVASHPSLLAIPYKDVSSTPIISRPIPRREHSAPLEELLMGKREMTLKMTLTRPDLRDGEALVAPSMERSKDRDPFALEQLPKFMGGCGNEQPASIWDTLPPAKQSTVKRMWRKVSGRAY